MGPLKLNKIYSSLFANLTYSTRKYFLIILRCYFIFCNIISSASGPFKATPESVVDDVSLFYAATSFPPLASGQQSCSRQPVLPASDRLRPSLRFAQPGSSPSQPGSSPSRPSPHQQEGPCTIGPGPFSSGPASGGAAGVPLRHVGERVLDAVHGSDRAVGAHVLGAHHVPCIAIQRTIGSRI